MRDYGSQATHPSPLGCLIGFFALVALAIGGLLLWNFGLFLWRRPTFVGVWSSFLVGGLVLVVLACVGFYLAYDAFRHGKPIDPDGPPFQ